MHNKTKINKKILIQTFVIFCTFMFLVALINLFKDNFGIFKNNYSKQEIVPNERYIRMKHLIKNPNKYDTLVIGSSRIAYINVKDELGINVYSFSAPYLSPYEVSRMVKVLVGKGVKIKWIIYGLENEALRLPGNQTGYARGNDIANLSYPVTLAEKIRFYSSYLFYFPFIDKTKRDIWIGQEYILDSGTWSQDYENSTKKYKEKNKHIKFLFGPPFKSEIPYNEKNIDYLKDLSDVCKKNNIKLTIFFSPETYDSYLLNDVATFNTYKKKIAKFTPYYDFSGKNKITKAKSNFENRDHYNYKTAQYIAKVIKEDKKEQNIDGDYGHFITEKNVDKILSDECKNTPNIKNCVPK